MCVNFSFISLLVNLNIFYCLNNGQTQVFQLSIVFSIYTQYIIYNYGFHDNVISKIIKLLNREKGYFPEVCKTEGNNPFEI